MARKQKVPEVWVIKEDGRRVAVKPTYAEAKTLAHQMEKSLPTYINFSFTIEKQQPSHITTA